eukprot:4048779-Amphidinium_carterae.1
MKRTPASNRVKCGVADARVWFRLPRTVCSKKITFLHRLTNREAAKCHRTSVAAKRITEQKLPLVVLMSGSEND